MDGRKENDSFPKTIHFIGIISTFGRRGSHYSSGIAIWTINY